MDYQNLEKVYSIWVCLNPSNTKQNTITRYLITEDHVIGHVCEPIQNYDLLSVIMVCLGDLNETNQDGILRLLDTIFFSADPEEKIHIMQDDFGIPVAPAMEREVNNMGSFSDVFFARGVERGLEQGVDKGKIELIQMLATNKNISIDEAMNEIGIPKPEQQKYLDMLKPQCV